MDLKSDSPAFIENDQNSYVYFDKFHIFLFTRKQTHTTFLLRKKHKENVFVHYKGNLRIPYDPNILFAAGRKLYKKTGGLLTNQNVKYFMTSNTEPVLLDDIKIVDFALEQPYRMDHSVYQEYVGKVCYTDYQYQFPSTRTIVYFVEIPEINVEKLNEYCKCRDLNFEFLETNGDDLFKEYLNVSSDTKTLLQDSGLNKFFLDYLINKKAIEFKRSYGMLCCSKLMTVNFKYQALYFSYFKKFGEKWRMYMIPEMEFPTEEDIKNFNAIIVPGSPNASYNDFPWKETYFKMINKIYLDHPNILMLGVCFGAQSIAHALGGDVARMSTGFMRRSELLFIQPTFYDLSYVKPLNIPKTGILGVAQSHGDHITKLPDEAILHASSERTKVEIYTIDDRVLGVQGHPEYSTHWVAGIHHKVTGQTKKFNEVYLEVLDTICKDKIDQEPFMLILFNFLKRYYN